MGDRSEEMAALEATPMNWGRVDAVAMPVGPMQWAERVAEGGVTAVTAARAAMRQAKADGAVTEAMRLRVRAVREEMADLTVLREPTAREFHRV